MLLNLVAGRAVVFVGGKGGVGKTSVASAMALAAARAGRRVLLVSTDPAHNLGHLWGLPLGDAPRGLPGADGRLDAIEIDPGATVSAHLESVRTTMRRMLPQRMHAAADRHLDLARSAPGTHESAVLDRVAECVELGAESYDLVVFDTAPTGHTLRLLSLPDQLTSWSDGLLANRDRAERFGAALRGLGGSDLHSDRDAELRRVLVRRRHRYALLRDIVADPERSGFVVVTTAERLPVHESAALASSLRELDVDVAALVVNRRSPDDAGAILAERRRREDDQLAVLRSRVAGVPVVEVPLLPDDVAPGPGLDALVSFVSAVGRAHGS